MLSAKTAGESLVSKIKTAQAANRLRITTLEAVRARDKEEITAFCVKLVESGPVAAVAVNEKAIKQSVKKMESVSKRVHAVEMETQKVAGSIKTVVRAEIERTSGAMQQCVFVFILPFRHFPRLSLASASTEGVHAHTVVVYRCLPVPSILRPPGWRTKPT